MIWYISKYDDKLVHIRLVDTNECGFVDECDCSIYIEKEKVFAVMNYIDSKYCDSTRDPGCFAPQFEID